MINDASRGCLRAEVRADGGLGGTHAHGPNIRDITRKIGVSSGAHWTANSLFRSAGNSAHGMTRLRQRCWWCRRPSGG
jgi:hypothetical protein